MKKFKRHPTQYDAILMDCEMPVMDGFKATRKIRRLEKEQDLPQVPIIALTGNALLANKTKCLEAGTTISFQPNVFQFPFDRLGMTDFLAKPITRATLSKVLDKVSFATYW